MWETHKFHFHLLFASSVSSNAVKPREKLRWTDCWLIILLILAAALPYANTLLNSFVYDDRFQVLQNPYVVSFRYVQRIFTTSVWSFVPDKVSNYYRPMMTLGYLVCYKLFGFNAWGFHIVNVFLHTAIVCLFFFVTLQIFGDRVVAFLAASLFALHPIHTESVAWIAGVTDLELTFFYLLTFWRFAVLDSRPRKHSQWTHLAMLASFVFALLSKEQALTLPFLATAYEHFYREDRAKTSRGQKFERYRALWMLAIAYLLCRLHFLRAFAPEVRLADLTWYQTLLSAFALVGQYLGKLLWPVHLCAFYVFHKSVSLLEPRVLLAGGGGLILAAALFAFLWKHARMASFGIIWILATLAPVLNPHWVSASAFAERYLYLPSVGFCWLLACGLRHLWVKRCSQPARRSALVTALGVLAALCVLQIVVRNRDWQNDVVLAIRTLALSPDAHGFRLVLGKAYVEQGDLEDAEREYRQILELDVDPSTYAGALGDLGGLLAKKGQYTEAIAYLLRAIETDPKDAVPRANLGVIYWREARMEEAEANLRAAAALSPYNIPVHLDLGHFYWQKGDHVQAEASFRRALSINPADSSVHLALAEIYFQEGRTTEATREYHSVLETDPANLEASLGLERLRSQTSGLSTSTP